MRVKSVYSVEQVLAPTSVYNGQKLTRLVSTKTPATTSSTMPKAPVTVLVINSPTKIAASNSLIPLSAAPIFFVISIIF